MVQINFKFHRVQIHLTGNRSPQILKSNRISQIHSKILQVLMEDHRRYQLPQQLITARFQVTHFMKLASRSNRHKIEAK